MGKNKKKSQLSHTDGHTCVHFLKAKAACHKNSMFWKTHVSCCLFNVLSFLKDFQWMHFQACAALISGLLFKIESCWWLIFTPFLWVFCFISWWETAVLTWRWTPDTPHSFNSGWRGTWTGCSLRRHGMTSPAGLFNKTALHHYQFSYEITLREPTFRAIAVIWLRCLGFGHRWRRLVFCVS